MRISTGVHGFDELIEGGLPRSRLFVISGPPGSGKTTFTAQYVAEGLRNGERCMYVTLHETRDELVADMSRYGFGFAELADSDRFHYVNLMGPQGQQLLRGGNGSGVSAVASRLVALVNSRSVDRLVIDSTMLLKLFFENSDEEMTRFLTMVKGTDATTLLVSEMTDPRAYADEHYLSHGVIFFHNYLDADGMTRGIQVVKMRGTNIDCDIRPIGFGPGGLVVDAAEKVAV